MDNAVTSQAEGDEEILTFDIPDEALERAASAEQAYTLARRNASFRTTRQSRRLRNADGFAAWAANSRSSVFLVHAL